jgi:hypothetical protein
MHLLNKSSLAISLGRSRCYVSAMVRSGYRMQYGTRTTFRHALKWLEENPHFVTTEVYPHRPKPRPSIPSNRKSSDVDKSGELAHSHGQ